ncbi:MAG: hypothetical protein HY927_02580 [Elusimicrobia bacterium]|nr:hypothetical protein [Elusimicrobiota bacterium]
MKRFGRGWFVLLGLLLAAQGFVVGQETSAPPEGGAQPAAAQPGAAEQGEVATKPKPKPKAKAKAKAKKKKRAGGKYEKSKYYAIVPAAPSTYRWGPDGKPIQPGAKKKGKKKADADEGAEEPAQDQVEGSSGGGAEPAPAAAADEQK